MENKQQSPIYIFSGLGVDERVFQHIIFPGYEPVFIRWVPIAKGESLRSYAAKLRTQIAADNPVLVGLSFGGVMAQEVARLMPVSKIILIASVKSAAEFPFYYRLAAQLQLPRLLPAGLLKSYNRLTNWLFGINNKEDARLMKDILRDTDPVFLKWALMRLPEWKNDPPAGNTISIHGNKDRLLPIRNVQSNIVVKDAGHFLTVNKPEIINMLLEDLLGS